MNRHLPVPPRNEYYTQRLHDLSNVLSVHSYLFDEHCF